MDIARPTGKTGEEEGEDEGAGLQGPHGIAVAEGGRRGVRNGALGEGVRPKKSRWLDLDKDLIPHLRKINGGCGPATVWDWLLGAASRKEGPGRDTACGWGHYGTRPAAAARGGEVSPRRHSVC